MTLKQETRLKIILTEAHVSYKDSLKSYAYFKVRNKMASEDLVQNTFMKTWTYLKRGGQIQTMKAFLYHVLNNLIIDEYRKRKALSLDFLMEKGLEPNVVDGSNIVNVLDGKAAFRFMDRLPPMYKNVLHMKYLEDLSTEEISNATGLSKNTVAVRIHRGMVKLKSLYAY